MAWRDDRKSVISLFSHNGHVERNDNPMGRICSLAGCQNGDRGIVLMGVCLGMDVRWACSLVVDALTRPQTLVQCRIAVKLSSGKLYLPSLNQTDTHFGEGFKALNKINLFLWSRIFFNYY